MNKWRVVVYLSCHETMLDCIHHGPENDSDSVAKTLFQGKRENEFVGMRGREDDSNIFVRVKDIVAFDISPLK